MQQASKNINASVLILHGLGRTARAMNPIANHLTMNGYEVHNLDYPSRKHRIEKLVAQHVTPAIERLPADQPIHVVTHSLGGILIRHYLRDRDLPEGSRIVMLAPPNHGSEVADHLRHWPVFSWLLGPALQQLGTGPEGIHSRLGPAETPTGILTGNHSVYPPFSWWIIGPNDGLVSVDSARLANMADFRVLNCGHGLIMNKHETLALTSQFLATGQFR